MTSERVERRLAVVLAADVAGYSRLMGADEIGTLAALKSHRREVVDPAIAQYHGRIVKTTGDGMLVEFASAVDAVTCAMEVQGKMMERNASTNLKITFRIRINVGDIIIDSDAIFGDGVNVAARVENECEPGCVCLSGSAFEQVRGKTHFAYGDLGERSLKNIDRPVRLYEARPASSAQATSAKPLAEYANALALPDRPSVAVLPFTNMSGDPEQEYFADGMAEDIITALSRFKSLFVIARISSFTYKGRSVDIKQVGRELGVRYVSEGSVRKAGGRVRITGQLIEAETNRHIWADKFDGDLEAVFDLQDMITSSVVGCIAPKVELAEIERAKSKPTDKLDSYDFICVARLPFIRGPLCSTLSSTSKSIERGPEFAAAYAMAAFMLHRQQADSGLPLTADKRAEAISLAREAARLATDDAFALARCGHTLTYLAHEYDRGAALVEQAVELNPNLAVAWYSRGWVALMSDEFERANESFERMIRLSPVDPLQAHNLLGLSLALFNLNRYEGSASALKAMQFAANVHTLGAYIINSVRAGHRAKNQEPVGQLLELHPNFHPLTFKKSFRYVPVRRGVG
jgi:TolB-like protein/class 3 adenylate cyclase